MGGQSFYGQQFDPAVAMDQRSMMAHFTYPVAIKTLGFQMAPVNTNDLK